MHRCRLCLLLLAPLLALALPSAGQQARLELAAQGAYMMPNNFNMPEFNRGAAGVEFAWWRRTDGDEEWKQRRAYPYFGLKGSFLYIVDGPSGHRFGLSPALKAPLFGHRLFYSMALGASVYTKPYCLTHDPENIFIGPWVSFLIEFGLTYHLGDRLLLGASLLHTSNGGLYRPNKGLNYLQFSLGYALTAGDGSDLRATPDRHTMADGPRREVGFTLSHGLVMSRHLMQDGYFPCYDLAVNYMRYLTPVVAVGGNVDLWYNHSHTWQLPRYHDRYPLPVYLGLQGAVEGFWGPVSLRLGVGVVALASSRVGMRLYERMGLYYNWGRNYVGLGLNARAGMIEFVELGYGLRLPLGRHGR